jgi:hypothetical protein
MRKVSILLLITAVLVLISFFFDWIVLNRYNLPFTFNPAIIIEGLALVLLCGTIYVYNPKWRWIIVFLVIICILLYYLEINPNFQSWLWKLVGANK